jgi:hypothetical protein
VPLQQPRHRVNRERQHDMVGFRELEGSVKRVFSVFAADVPPALGDDAPSRDGRGCGQAGPRG